MAGISVLVSKDLRTLLDALRGLPAETNKQIQKATKSAALPIWQDEVKSNVTTRLEARVLGQTAKVGVTKSNVFLRSGQVGKLSSGLPVSVLSQAVEYGRPADAPIPAKGKMVSKNGVRYTRRSGTAFRPRNRKGYVANEAGRDSIPRYAALWISTAVRTLHEQMEKGAR
jgi:hypothetical protein